MPLHDLMTIAATVVPPLLFLAAFYFLDAFREPRRVVLTTFLLGFLAVVPPVAVWIGLKLFGVEFANPYLSAFVHAFGMAAIPEEVGKFFVLYFYCSRHVAFDEPMDGLVYGATASLGFATLENAIYVAGGGLPVAAMRAFTSIPAHATMGVIMGYFFSRAHFDRSASQNNYAAALLVPIALHGLYDFPLMAMMAGVRGPMAVVLGLVTLGVLIGSVFYAFSMARQIRALQLRSMQNSSST